MSPEESLRLSTQNTSSGADLPHCDKRLLHSNQATVDFPRWFHSVPHLLFNG